MANTQQFADLFIAFAKGVTLEDIYGHHLNTFHTPFLRQTYATTDYTALYAIQTLTKLKQIYTKLHLGTFLRLSILNNNVLQLALPKEGTSTSVYYPPISIPIDTPEDILKYLAVAHWLVPEVVFSVSEALRVPKFMISTTHATDLTTYMYIVGNDKVVLLLCAPPGFANAYWTGTSLISNDIPDGMYQLNLYNTPEIKVHLGRYTFIWPITDFTKKGGLNSVIVGGSAGAGEALIAYTDIILKTFFGG